MCRTPKDAGSVDIPPRPPETKKMIESKLIPCERCGMEVPMLIPYPSATRIADKPFISPPPALGDFSALRAGDTEPSSRASCCQNF